MYSFTVRNLVFCSTFTRLCNHHHYLLLAGNRSFYFKSDFSYIWHVPTLPLANNETGNEIWGLVWNNSQLLELHMFLEFILNFNWIFLIYSYLNIFNLKIMIQFEFRHSVFIILSQKACVKFLQLAWRWLE